MQIETIAGVHLSNVKDRRWLLTTYKLNTEAKGLFCYHELKSCFVVDIHDLLLHM